MFVEDYLEIKKLVLSNPYGVVGLWGLPMTMEFMCMLPSSPFVFYVCGLKARDV